MEEMKAKTDQDCVIEALNDMLRYPQLELKKSPVGYYLFDTYKQPHKRINQIPLKTVDAITGFIGRYIVNLKVRNNALYKEVQATTFEPLAKTS